LGRRHTNYQKQDSTNYHSCETFHFSPPISASNLASFLTSKYIGLPFSTLKKLSAWYGQLQFQIVPLKMFSQAKKFMIEGTQATVFS